MSVKFLLKGASLVFTVLLLGIGSRAVGQQNGGLYQINPFDSKNFRPNPSLVVPHAAIDPTTGDLLLLSNAWPNEPVNLRRFHPDGTSDPKFVLQRFENCCALHPSLVAVDGNGNIYTLAYDPGILTNFYIYKHAPSGQIDIDWGYGDQPTKSMSSGSSYGGGSSSGASQGTSKAVTTLDKNAGGGRFEYHFTNPVDMIPRSDGALLILDQGQRTVFLIDPTGKNISSFIGSRGYIPNNPMRLISDKSGNLYIVDFYGISDLFHNNMAGVFKFNPDGSLVGGWGEVSNGINDSGRPTIDFNTLVVDGKGTLIAMGGSFSDANHGEVFTFDPANGAMWSRNNADYMMGPDTGFLGMLGWLEEGFIHLQGRDFAVLVDNYDNNGKRKSQIKITDLYPAE
jgi:hypothetical protein